MTPLLALRLSVDYPGRPEVLRDVRLEMAPGELLGLAGASGSGKSTLALAIMRLLDFRGGRARGEILFEGQDLLRLPETEMRRLRGRRIALVLQSPLAALNPYLRIARQFREVWAAHVRGGEEEFRRRVAGLLESVGLPSDESFLRRYPGQLSVGQAQRVLIAMAILHRPALLVADEPTSALDPITQADLLDLLVRLNRELGMGVLLISHDLLWTARLCHRVAVLHEGKIVECAAPEQLLSRPAHPYVRRLVAALSRPLRAGFSEGGIAPGAGG